MLSELEQFKLKMARNKFGAMNSNEALNIALLSEQTAEDVCFGDPAFGYFRETCRGHFEYAVLLEKEESANKNTREISG